MEFFLFGIAIFSFECSFSSKASLHDCSRVVFGIGNLMKKRITNCKFYYISAYSIHVLSAKFIDVCESFSAMWTKTITAYR